MLWEYGFSTTFYSGFYNFFCLKIAADSSKFLSGVPLFALVYSLNCTYILPHYSGSLVIATAAETIENI